MHPELGCTNLPEAEATAAQVHARAQGEVSVAGLVAEVFHVADEGVRGPWRRRGRSR